MNIHRDRQITIQQKTVTKDTATQAPVVSWATLVDCWAEVMDVLPSRSESARDGLQQGRTQTRIRIRYRSGIDSSMRVVVHGDSDQVYQIVGGPAEIGGRKRYLELLCERYIAQGDG